MADAELPDALRDELRAAWHRYLDLVAPLRPALHRYCRRLTGNLWDAEDLVQETLLRAFGTLGSLHQRVENPRAYLFRAATNVWIDTLRRRGTEADALAAQAGGARSRARRPRRRARRRRHRAPAAGAPGESRRGAEGRVRDDPRRDRRRAGDDRRRREGRDPPRPLPPARAGGRSGFASPRGLGGAGRPVRHGVQQAGSRGPAQPDARHRFGRERRLRRAGRPRGLQRQGRLVPRRGVRAPGMAAVAPVRLSAHAARLLSAASRWRSASPPARARKPSSR